MALDRILVAERLRKFGQLRFGTMKDFAAALKMHPASLNSGYLSGRSILGGELLAHLHSLGCDITWLLTGEPQKGLSEEEQKMFFWLKKEGITTEKKLQERLTVISDIWGAASKIAEVKTKYSAKSKSKK